MDIIKGLGIIAGAAFCYYKGRSDMARDIAKTGEAAVEVLNKVTGITEEETEE